MKKINKHNQDGFTMVEIMVVVVIVAILAAVALPTYFALVQNAYASEPKTVISNIENAGKMYYQTYGENRVAAIPATVKEMVKIGMDVFVETGAGEKSHFSNDDYKAAGADIVSDRSSLWAQSDIILKVAPAELDEIDMMKDGTAYVSFFQTTILTDHVKKLVNKNISAFSMHLIHEQH